jgi:hypothetical protein
MTTSSDVIDRQVAAARSSRASSFPVGRQSFTRLSSITWRMA